MHDLQTIIRLNNEAAEREAAERKEDVGPLFTTKEVAEAVAEGYREGQAKGYQDGLAQGRKDAHNETLTVLLELGRG